MYVYSIQQITGAGYECDEIGIFDTLASAMKAIVDHCKEKGFEFYRYHKLQSSGAYRIAYEISSVPYYLHYVVKPVKLNELKA